MNDTDRLHFAEGGLELLEDLHEGRHEEDFLVVAVDLNGGFVVDKFLQFEGALCDDDVLGLNAFIYLELVESVTLLVLGYFLEIDDLIKDCHFKQISRADHAFPCYILDNNRDCLGCLDMDVMLVGDIDWQFEGIAIEVSIYGQLANHVLHHFFNRFIVVVLWMQGELEPPNFRVAVRLEVRLK